MNGQTGIGKPALNILFQVVTHQVCFLHSDTLRHDKVKVNETLVSRFAGTYFVKTGQLIIVLFNAGKDFSLFLPG